MSYLAAHALNKFPASRIQTKVTLQGLAHALYQLTGKKLEDYQCPLGLGEFSPWGQSLGPLEKRPILTTLSDEEKCQFRALNLLYGVLKIRGMPQSDYAHRAWNDVTLALNRSGLKPAVLKGTLICTYYRGPYQSAAHAYDLQTAARKLMLTAPDSLLEELSTFEKQLRFEILLIYITGIPSLLLVTLVTLLWCFHRITE